jgi:hypothetical protein
VNPFVLSARGLGLGTALVILLALGCGVEEVPIAMPAPGPGGDAAAGPVPDAAVSTPTGGGGNPGAGGSGGAAGATGGRSGSGGAGGAGGRRGNGNGGRGGRSGRDAGTNTPDAATTPVDAGGTSPQPAPVPPTPAPPAAQLPPGGPVAAKDRIVVFLHVGHSNMAGRATDPANLRPYFYDTDPRLWSFHGANPTLGNMPFAWGPAKEPLSPDVMTGSKAGPGMALLRAALALARPEIQLVSVGHGHSGEAGGLCRNFKKGGLFYNIMMGPAIRLKGAVTFGALFTMLGTTERHADVSTQNGFSDCMAQLAADVRGDLEAPELPIIMSDFEMEATGDTSPQLPYAKIIIEQLRVATGKITRSALIPTEGLGMDGSHHFNLAGHKEWGTRGVQILKDKGWAPWAK